MFHYKGRLPFYFSNVVYANRGGGREILNVLLDLETYIREGRRRGGGIVAF